MDTFSAGHAPSQGMRPDRTSMLKAFDLWSFPDVVAHQDAILGQVRSGHMPCDGAWPAEKVSMFAYWISQGSQP